MPRKRTPNSNQDLSRSLDLHDYLNIFRPRLPKTPASRVSISVIDDWPRVVPIGMREIEVTETHLEKVLAELLGPLP